MRHKAADDQDGRPHKTESGQASGALIKNIGPHLFSTIEPLGVAEIVEQQHADEQAETHIHLRSSQRGTPFRHKDRS